MNNQNQNLAYLCDRIQKITEAVYRVTDLLHEKEPVKWEIRKRALSIFTELTSFQNKHLLERKAGFEKIENSINQLTALFSLFSENKTISGVNFGILKQEYESAKSSMSIPQEKSQKAKKLQPARIGQSIGRANGHIDSRKTRILDIIKQRKEITVGELSGVFTEYSGKTIQRDLLEMVNKGLLKKQGDKRWRKYMLVD